jgi:hypothetical protein
LKNENSPDKPDKDEEREQIRIEYGNEIDRVQKTSNLLKRKLKEMMRNGNVYHARDYLTETVSQY